jgi:mannitol/fructose-specific phosphotransferase system IIA component (Ntr-type)
MSAIAQALTPARVDLNMPARPAAEAVASLMGLFFGDPMVSDFEALKAAVAARPLSEFEGHGCGIAIAHGRTNAVRHLAMAAGRLAPRGDMPLRLVFVACIPATMNSEYLRAVGAVARACKDPDHLGALLEATSGDAFINLLASAENPAG